MTQKYNNKRKRAYGILIYIKDGKIKKSDDVLIKDIVDFLNGFYKLNGSDMLNYNNWRNADKKSVTRTAIPFNELEDDIRKLEPYLKGETQNNTTDQNITINKSDFDNLMVRLSELEKENMILKNKLNNI